MVKTTIQLKKETLNKLKKLKTYNRQSYDEVLNIVIDNFDEEILSNEEIVEIKASLDNVAKGNIRSIENIAKDLGVKLN